MFLRAITRKKDRKEHRYWRVVENRRVADGRVVQRHVLYLGEINSSQELAWRKSIEVLDEDAPSAVPRTYALFPGDRCEAVLPDESIVRLKLKSLQLHRPRQWGACWLALTVWQMRDLDLFWAERLPASRKRANTNSDDSAGARCRGRAQDFVWSSHGRRRHSDAGRHEEKAGSAATGVQAAGALIATLDLLDHQRPRFHEVSIRSRESRRVLVVREAEYQAPNAACEGLLQTVEEHRLVDAGFGCGRPATREEPDRQQCRQRE
jgi:hypothetical protein